MSSRFYPSLPHPPHPPHPTSSSSPSLSTPTHAHSHPVSSGMEPTQVFPMPSLPTEDESTPTESQFACVLPAPILPSEEDEAPEAEAEPEQCPLCPPSGPSTSEVLGDIGWIECNKCDEWFHSACVSTHQSSTIPAGAIVEGEDKGRAKSDWPKMVDRWFCQKCIDYSTSPDNPKPPRQPLVASLKKSLLKKRPAPATDPAAQAPSPSRSSKRIRAEVKSEVKNEVKSEVRSEVADQEPANPEAREEQAQPQAEALEARGRPKRQAALHAPDYANMHNHVPTPTRTWLELIKDPAATGRVIGADDFPRVPGDLLSRDWLDSTVSYPKFPPEMFWGDAREPLVVRPEDGGIESLGGKVPGQNFTVADVARLVGPDRMVDVIDVATQQSSQWKLSKWATYLAESQSSRASQPTAPSTPAQKVYNIISLEISGTELAKRVRPPKIVSEIDWVDNFWYFKGGKQAVASAAEAAAKEAVKEGEVGKGVNGEAHGKEKGGKEKLGKVQNLWPKVQLYCLMGMRDSWTDWHVDFAASSVYYHIHTGSKVFFFIRPTERNLAAYKEWSGSAEMQQSVWLPDKCDGVRKITLNQGDTMIIPAGYIHAVYTPIDSIVFGGNFLHSYNIEAQLRLRQIEIDTKVPQRFRFPFFERLCWYVADRYCTDLRNLRAFRPSRSPSPRLPATHVLLGLLHLARFLVSQADLIEDTSADDKARRSAFDRVPTDVAVDPSGLPRELMWRVEREVPLEMRESEADGKEKIADGKKGGKIRARKSTGGAGVQEPVRKSRKSSSLRESVDVGSSTPQGEENGIKVEPVPVDVEPAIVIDNAASSEPAPVPALDPAPAQISVPLTSSEVQMTEPVMEKEPVEQTDMPNGDVDVPVEAIVDGEAEDVGGSGHAEQAESGVQREVKESAVVPNGETKGVDSTVVDKAGAEVEVELVDAVRENGVNGATSEAMDVDGNADTVGEIEPQGLTDFAIHPSV